MSADRPALLESFHHRFERPAELVAEAPGRVNLIGEHTDYNEGHVLPLAIDRTVAVAGAARDGATIRACSLDFEEEDDFELDRIERREDGGWRNCVRGVAHELREAGHGLRGADLAFSGDVPPGAGLSSSAALEVAVAGALAAVSGLEIEPRELALIAQRAENGFAGVQCGVMDQLAAALGREDAALLIDCRNLEVEAVPLPADGPAIVVVDSGVRRELGDSPYNQRREECAQAAAALGVAALRDLTAGELERRRGELERTLYRRARHVVLEETRVLAAAETLRRGEMEPLGRLLFGSHRSLRDDFEVSCPELDLLVELAAECDGVLGARLTGAGFGGCTVNLVWRDALEAFRRDVVAVYRERTGLAAEMGAVRGHEGLTVTRA
ncbi:MAG: galactokinase [Dehalococcoidia bacterium]